jgi:anthranilate synthase/aminodeoxychorismate synthase-like glutamine amidotransferase
MIVLLDNYDSFTWNLVHLFAEVGVFVDVVANDAMDADALAAIKLEAIVLSPGPGTPNDAGITLAVIERLAGVVPLFGVCLGMQAIAQAFGAKVVRARAPMHGRTSDVEHDGRGLFCGVPSPFRVMRYHSLAVDESTLPDCLEVSARADDGTVMAIRHRSLRVEGVQFHPESFLSEHGVALARNFANWLPGPPSVNKV